MASEDDKFIDAIVKLISLTQDGQIKWSTDSPRESLNRDEEVIVELIYTTRYKNKILGLYEKKHKVNPNDYAHATYRLVPSLNLGSTKAYWTSSVVLEILDTQGNNIWTFPQVQGLTDLLRTVKYHTADVDGFLESLLNK